MEVLIRNFNTTTGQFDLFHEEIVDLTPDEIHQLMLDLPSETDFTIYVITESRIFYKSGEYLYRRINKSQIIKKFKKTPLTEITENFFIPTYSITIRSNIAIFNRCIILIYFCLGLLSLPIINLYTIIIGFGQIISIVSVFSIFIMLTLASLFTLLAMILAIIKGIKSIYFEEYVKDIKLEYSSIEHFYFTSWDPSGFIMFDLQLFFPFLLDIYSVLPLSSFINHYWLILIIFSPTYMLYLIIPGFLAINMKKKIKERKKILKILQRLIQSEPGLKKNFYLTIYLKLKEEKFVKIGLLTKISALITFLLIFLA